MNNNMLTLDNLTKNFGRKTVVDKANFQVKRGEIMGLLGPNGAGKTTAIRMIMGILKPDDGKVIFHFSNGKSGMDKRKIGYLPEERGLYDDAKVLDTLIYLSGLKGKSRHIAREEGMNWLKNVGLSDYAQHKLEKLSKGMQQKVQFIASILHEPELVVLDEPFSGLDPINQDFMKDTIRELQKKGMTVLLSAHQMNMVEELCDSIFMINQGRQVLYGNLEEIKNSYGDIMVEIRFTPGCNLETLHNMPDVSIEKQLEKWVQIRYTGEKCINKLLEEITNTIQVQEIVAKKPPLHDIFIQVAKEKGEEINEDEIL